MRPMSSSSPPPTSPTSSPPAAMSWLSSTPPGAATARRSPWNTQPPPPPRSPSKPRMSPSLRSMPPISPKSMTSRDSPPSTSSSTASPRTTPVQEPRRPSLSGSTRSWGPRCTTSPPSTRPRRYSPGRTRPFLPSSTPYRMLTVMSLLLLQGWKILSTFTRLPILM